MTAHVIQVVAEVTARPRGASTVITSSSAKDKNKKNIHIFLGYRSDIRLNICVTKRRIFISGHSSQKTPQCRATRHELCLDLCWSHGKRANWACASHYSGMLGGDQVTLDCSSIRAKEGGETATATERAPRELTPAHDRKKWASAGPENQWFKPDAAITERQSCFGAHFVLFVFILLLWKHLTLCLICNDLIKSRTVCSQKKCSVFREMSKIS